MANTFLYLFVGIFLLVVVALRPKLFWPALIFVTIGTADLMFSKYTIVDEYFTGLILLGGLLAISMRAIHFRKDREDIWDSLHKWVFILMVVYLIIQGTRGMLGLESLEKIRWLVYYGMLGVLLFMISKKGFPVPEPRKMWLIISGAALVYLLLYLGQVLFIKVVWGMDILEAHALGWKGSAYALFPLVIGIPAAIFLLDEKKYIRRWLGWATLATAILAVFYVDSRATWVAIIAFLSVSLFKLGLRRFIFFLLCFLLIFSLFLGVGDRAKFIGRAGDFYREMVEVVENIWVPLEQKHDIDRIIHIQVGFISISESWKNFLFGYGLRTSGFIISPHLKSLFEEHGLFDLAAKVKEDVSTEGFTALLVDTGFVGVFLLGMNFLFTAHKVIIQRENPYRIFLLLSLILTFFWLFLNNLLEIILFYLLIMPSGLLVQLSKHGTEENVLR